MRYLNQKIEINRQELKELLLELGNIPSPYGQEGPAAEYVYQWFLAHDIAVRKVGVNQERFSVVAIIPGKGQGTSLAFNAHLDTAIRSDDKFVMRNPEDPFYNCAWEENGMLFGEGIQNDKGAVACLMLVAKALKEYQDLDGDVFITASCGETGLEPVDEFQGEAYHAKDFGARYMLTHGGITADYAVVAEGTDFKVVWVEAGKAFFKVTLYGESTYTPWLTRPVNKYDNRQVFAVTARFIEEFEQWAAEYERKHRYECKGGIVVPRTQISCIRGGVPYYITRGAEKCYLYIDCRLNPKQKPKEVQHKLEALISKIRAQGEVELFVYRRGYESIGVEPAYEVLKSVHQSIMGTPLEIADAPYSSMWRDSNPFNEAGIPTLIYGPKRRCPISLEDFYKVSMVYLNFAMELCSKK